MTTDQNNPFQMLLHQIMQNNYEVTHALTCLSLHGQCYQLIFVDQKA